MSSGGSELLRAAALLGGLLVPLSLCSHSAAIALLLSRSPHFELAVEVAALSALGSALLMGGSLAALRGSDAAAYAAMALSLPAALFPPLLVAVLACASKGAELRFRPAAYALLTLLTLGLLAPLWVRELARGH